MIIIIVYLQLVHQQQNYQLLLQVKIGTMNQHITIYSITEQKGHELLNRFTIQEKLENDKICCVLFEKFNNGSYGYLFVGTINGYLFRFRLGRIFSVLKPFNQNFVSTLNCEFMKNLGSSSVKLKRCKIMNNKCIVAISSKNYIINMNNNNNNNNNDLCDILNNCKCIPLLYSYNDLINQSENNNNNNYKRIIFDDCSSFILNNNNKFIAIDSENSNILIYSIDNFGRNNYFETTIFPLRYTPREMCMYNNCIFIIESDCGEYSNIKRKQLISKTNGNISEEKQMIIGYPRPLNSNYWSSCFRIISPLNNACSTTFIKQFNDAQNETAFSMIIYNQNIENNYLVIGTKHHDQRHNHHHYQVIDQHLIQLHMNQHLHQQQYVQFV